MFTEAVFASVVAAPKPWIAPVCHQCDRSVTQMLNGTWTHITDYDIESDHVPTPRSLVR